MPQVRWTSHALRDVQKLSRFLNQKNREASKKAVAEIRKYARLLETTPDIGVPDEDDEYSGYRDLIIPFGASGYVLRYFLDNGQPIIVAVKHQKEAGFY
ncbi:Plasmid stabilization system protein ParE [Kosakonia sacchari]|nr:Plasmid stabilization system protein ParE [Kosakonia sacchari]